MIVLRRTELEVANRFQVARLLHFRREKRVPFLSQHKSAQKAIVTSFKLFYKNIIHEI